MCLLLISLIFFGINAKMDNHKALPWLKNGYHGLELDLVDNILPENPVIIEAGVGDGSDTCQMKKKWPNSVIYGFEASPRNFDLSVKTTSHLENVIIYPCALFDHVGKITFYLSQKIPAASSLLKDNLNNVKLPKYLDSSQQDLTYQDKPVEVDCITIDEWSKSANVPKVDYMWLDAEGAEIYILRAAKSILSGVKAISTEVNFQEFRVGMTIFADLYEFLVMEGFKLKYIWGNASWQATAVFVRE